MTFPSSLNIERPADDVDVVEALNAVFRLPAFVSPREVDATRPTHASPRPATSSEYVAMALFVCLAIASAALVVVSVVD